MSATLRATLFVPKKEDSTAEERLKGAAQWLQPITLPAQAPTLRVVPLLRENQPRRFVRVPTHAVGVFPEHREYPRASLKLPLKLRGVDSVRETFPITLVTRDVSSTGVYFLCPKPLAVGASIELEIVLVSRPLGRGNVVVASMAHVMRMEPAAMPNWYGIAASFDDVEFDRDDGIPVCFF
jgi:PilZ domain-containing protein